MQRARPGAGQFEADDDDDPAPAPRASAPAFTPPPALAPFERTELGTRWYALISQCAEAGKLIAMVRALAMQSELVDCEPTARRPRGACAWASRRCAIPRWPTSSA